MNHKPKLGPETKKALLHPGLILAGVAPDETASVKSLVNQGRFVGATVRSKGVD